MSASSVGSFLTLCVTFYSGFFEAVLMFSSDRDRPGFRTTTKQKKQRDMIIENVEDDIEMDEISVLKKRLTRLMRVKTKSRKAKKYF